jgi:hypothetical protein
MSGGYGGPISESIVKHFAERSKIRELALPYDRDTPTQTIKFRKISLIPSYVV